MINPVSDSLANARLPVQILNDPINCPAQELLDALEFGAPATPTGPNRAKLLASFMSDLDCVGGCL